jgi:translation elongation factor EF-G
MVCPAPFKLSKKKRRLKITDWKVNNSSTSGATNNHSIKRKAGNMNQYHAGSIRNVVIMGHGSEGKTSLAEAIYFNSGAINRLGKVDGGTSVSDFDPDEIKRKLSINLSLLPLEWDGIKINLLDVPGYPDFIGDVKSAARVVKEL